MENIRRKRRGATSGYAAAVKRKAVLQFTNGNETLEAVAIHYGVTRTSLRRWLIWYEKDQASLLTLGSMEPDSTNAAAISGEDSGPTSNTPSASELKALQEELRLAKIKLTCLETLIDVTEQDLGIDIRKKAGTRSSEE